LSEVSFGTEEGLVSGHDFSRADKARKLNGPQPLSEFSFGTEEGLVSGHDFSRADKARKLNGL
jgi:hypothetical protein